MKCSLWITNGIAKSSRQKQKLYENVLKRCTPERKKLIKLKKTFLKWLYENLVEKFQGDARKIRCIMKELIGKCGIEKLSFPQKVVIDKV